MADVGCLLIGEMLSEPFTLDDWAEYLAARGVRTEVFKAPTSSGILHAQLQRAYQRIRRDGGLSCIVAAGSGCDCAMALAGQLPVDRAVLLEPVNWRETGGLASDLRRVRRYARRGAALCVCDALIVPGPKTGDALVDKLRDGLCNSRLTVVERREDLWTNRKEVLKLGVYRFLTGASPSKCLAQNPEMCIIYG